MAGDVRIAQRKVRLRDPHDCTDSADELTVYHAVFDTLVKRMNQGFVPYLARHWSVSDDARTWQFDLQPDHVFHDGTACDAAAVVKSLKRMARPDKGYTLGAPGVWAQYLATAQITALNSRTVELRLDEPLADLLDILEQAFIVAPAAIARLDRGDTTNPIGSGPYRVTTANDHEVTATRVADHFAPGPHATVTWISEPSAIMRQQRLVDGTVHVANDLAPQEAMKLAAVGCMALEYLSPVAIIYLLNAAGGPMSDARVRRAISLAVDRKSLIAEVLDGHGTPLLGIVSPVHFGAGETAGDIHDPDLARNLLADAGYGDGLLLEVDCPTRLPDEAEVLTATLSGQLAAVGISLTVHRHEEREAYAHMVRRKEIHDLCVFDSSPMSTFRVLYEKIDARVAGSWWQGYRNNKVEALLDSARAEPDGVARAAIYASAYAELQADPAWLTLYNPTRVIGLAGMDRSFTMPVDGVIDVTMLPADLA